ncbi:MAG: sigma-70 family RNA polymerase sigma factor [Planctomycetes bacterium]|nr:sigma-70 family RNA polymerase sigma factor [Planctomycetota bacterium]
MTIDILPVHRGRRYGRQPPLDCSDRMVRRPVDGPFTRLAASTGGSPPVFGDPIMNDDRQREIEGFQSRVGKSGAAEFVFEMTLFHELMHHLAHRICRSAAAHRLRHDIVQEASRTIYIFLTDRRAGDYNPQQTVQQYLECLIYRHLWWARGAALRSERRQSPQLLAELPETLPAACSVDEDLYQTAFQRVVGAVLAMRPNVRFAAWMYFFENRPLKAIAGALGVNQSRVAQLLAEARQIIRAVVTDLLGD